MNEKFMIMAINEAKKAAKLGEVPVGAVIVKDDIIISKAYNTKEKQHSVTRHAEIIAVEKASKKFKNWRLDGCDIYITLEPCPMCASAIKQARISRVFYGLSNYGHSNKDIICSIFDKDKNNKGCQVNCGYFEKEIEYMLKSFFKNRRLNKKIE